MQMRLVEWVILIIVVFVFLVWLTRDQRHKQKFVGLAPLAPGERGLRYFANETNNSFVGSLPTTEPPVRPDWVARAAAEALESVDEESDASEVSTDTFSAERRANQRAARNCPALRRFAPDDHRKVISQPSAQPPSPALTPAADDHRMTISQPSAQPPSPALMPAAENTTNEESVSLETPKSFHGGGQSSPKEEICRKVLEEIYGLPFPKVRPAFLKNVDTGRNLELDGYCHEIRVGFEFNGAQHYTYPNSYHKNSQEFMRQVRRDNYKYRLCKRLGIHLIVVPHDVPPAQIRDFIIRQLPQKGRGVIYVNPKSS